jgi:hypothetical protein
MVAAKTAAIFARKISRIDKNIFQKTYFHALEGCKTVIICA